MVGIMCPKRHIGPTCIRMIDSKEINGRYLVFIRSAGLVYTCAAMRNGVWDIVFFFMDSVRAAPMQAPFEG